MEVVSISPRPFVTHLCEHADSIPTLRPAGTQQSDDIQPQPHLIVSTHDGQVAFLPNGRRVATGSRDRTVKVWNLENGEQEGMSVEHESEITGLAVRRWDGMKIISGDEGGRIKVWNVESHKLVKEWTDPGCWPQMAISLDDRLIAVGDRATSMAIYAVEGRQVKHSIEVDKDVWSMSFSPDGKKTACGAFDDIRVYDADTGMLVLGLSRGHQCCIRDVQWSRDGGRLFSGSHDKTIRCWVQKNKSYIRGEVTYAVSSSP